MTTEIKMHNAGWYDFANPTAEMVNLHDIVQSLAKEQRFQNQLDKDWTVLQHVLLVQALVKINGGTEEQQYIALHHDDAEAYFRDMATPLKALCNDYRRLYSKCETVIGEKFNVSLQPLDGFVKEMDRKALMIEDVLFSVVPGEWHGYTINDYNSEPEEVKEVVHKIAHMLREKVKQEYIKQHHMLCPSKQLIS